MRPPGPGGGLAGWRRPARGGGAAAPDGVEGDEARRGHRAHRDPQVGGAVPGRGPSGVSGARGDGRRGDRASGQHRVIAVRGAHGRARPVVLPQRGLDRGGADLVELGLGEPGVLVGGDRVLPVAGGDGQQDVLLAQPAPGRRGVGPVLRAAAGEAVDVGDEELQVAGVVEAVERGRDLGGAALERTDPVGDLAAAGQPDRVVGQRLARLRDQHGDAERTQRRAPPWDSPPHAPAPFARATSPPRGCDGRLCAGCAVRDLCAAPGRTRTPPRPGGGGPRDAELDGTAYYSLRRLILLPSQTSGSYLRSMARSLSGISALSVIWMCSGHTSVQHLVMLQ